VCHGKLKGLDTLEMNLKKYIAIYPKSELKDKANEILLAINNFRKQKIDTTSTSNISEQSKITFTNDSNALHYFFVITPDEPKLINNLKNSIDAFNQKYFSNEQFSITSYIFADKKQLILVKSFGNAEKAKKYYSLIINDEETFNLYPKNELEFYIITDENFKTLIKEKALNDYKLFFEKYYKINGKS
jgi:hypothetical protein